MIYTSNSSQDIWDVALDHYGGAEGISFLLEENPDLIDVNGEMEEGRRQYIVDQRQAGILKEKFPRKIPAAINPVIYTSNSQQTVWDVALQFTGDAAGIAGLLERNPGLIDGSGQVTEGRITHKIPTEILNRPIWRRMIDYIPTTGLQDETTGQAWITDGNEPWTTENGQEWWTQGI